MRNRLFYIIWMALPLIAIAHCTVYYLGWYTGDSLYWVFRLGILAQTLLLMIYAMYIAKPHKALHYLPVLICIPFALLPQAVYYMTGNIYFDLILIIAAYAAFGVTGIIQDLGIVDEGKCDNCGKTFWVQLSYLKHKTNKDGIIPRKRCPSCKKSRLQPL